MPERRLLQIAVSSQARRDIAGIVRWSVKEFGEAAAIRYRELIFQAFHELASDPERPGTKSRPEVMVDNARTYPLSFTRSRQEAMRVKKPRHLILYRLHDPGIVEIARILHDSRDLKKHVPASYRRT